MLDEFIELLFELQRLIDVNDYKQRPFSKLPKLNHICKKSNAKIKASEERIKYNLGRFVPAEEKTINSDFSCAIVCAEAMKLDHQTKIVYLNISSSIRSRSKNDRKWNSYLGAQFKKFKVDSSSINYLLASKKDESPQLYFSFRCLEILNHILIGGGSGPLLIFSEDLSKIEARINKPTPREIYSFVYFKKYEIYLNSEMEFLVKGPDIIKPICLKHKGVKYYHKNRLNINRNMFSDEKNFYSLVCRQTEHEDEYYVRCYHISVFTSKDKILSIKPSFLMATKNVETFCINEKYVFGLHRTGAIVRVCKDNFKNFVVSKEDSDRRFQGEIKNKPNNCTRFKENFTTITANEIAVIIASEISDCRVFRILMVDPTTLRVLDETSVIQIQEHRKIYPIHHMNLICIKDLSILVVPGVMDSVYFFALVKRKLHQLNTTVFYGSINFVWGTSWNKNTQELIVYGADGYLSKNKIFFESDKDYFKGLQGNSFKYEREAVVKRTNRNVFNGVDEVVQTFNELLPNTVEKSQTFVRRDD